MAQRPQPQPRFSPELALEELFEPASREAWLDLVERGLRGAGLESLVTPGLDGIDIRPLYTAEDAPATAAAEAALTGDRPTRGWLICQGYAHPDPREVNRRIRQDLARGVEGIGLRLDRATRMGLSPEHPDWASHAGVDGILLASARDLEVLLEGVHLDMVHLAFEAGEASLELGAALRELLRQQGLARDAMRLALDLDPLGQLVSAGQLRRRVDRDGRGLGLQGLLSEAVGLWANRGGQVRTLGVSTLPYHAAGASPAQELAYALATATAYLSALAGAGWDAATACDQLRFHFAVDADFFGSVAKLRAARRLFCRLQRGLGGNVEAAGTMRIHAITSPRSLAAADPWVNLLRGTQQAAAAVVGGADQLTVQPFDGALGIPGDFGRRLAADTQSILQMEANLHRLADPAGGSHYLEWRSDRLARAAWDRFRAIEREGGMLAALLEGRVQRQVAETAAWRRRELAEGRRQVIGVTRYPPPAEQPAPAPEPPDLEGLRAAARARFEAMRAEQGGEAWRWTLGDGPDAAGAEPLVIPALRPMREGLPARSETSSDGTGSGPAPSTDATGRELGDA